MSNFKINDTAKTVTLENRVGVIVTVTYAEAGITPDMRSDSKYTCALLHLDYGVVCETCEDLAQDSGISAVDCNCGAHRSKGEISWRVSY